MATRTSDGIRRGARIHSLVRAAFLAHHPDRPFDVTWERLNYRRCDADGARGTVAFSKVGVVGLFYDPKSGQAPGNTKKAYALEKHLEGIPAPLLQHVKREALATMDLDVNGATAPVVTAAFWSDGEGNLVGARPWARLAADGARLVDTELLRPEKAIAAWAEKYGLSAAQVAVVTRLLGSKAKLATSSARVVLSAADSAALGLVTSQPVRELLEGAGIALG